MVLFHMGREERKRMSYRTNYTSSLNRKLRQSDRAQLNRIRCSSVAELLEGDYSSKESDRYLDTVSAIQSKLRRRPQFGGMGEEAGQQ